MKVGPNNPFAITDSPAKPATESQVKRLERRLGAKLPDDYRRFLLTINGGTRPGSWDLPKYDLAVVAFYGLRKDFHDLAAAVDRLLGPEVEAGFFPADTIPFVAELGDVPILMKYRGNDAGSIWFWDELRNGKWRKIAPSFDAFVAMLHQEPEPQGTAALRTILERDDVAAARRYVDSLPPGALDKPIEGSTLLQRATNAGAAKIVALLLDHGVRGIAGLGNANMKRHAKVVELLLTRGSYKPSESDWLGAAASGGPALLRIYFQHAPPPSRTRLELLVKCSNNLVKSKPSKEREEVIHILQARLASLMNTGGSVRKPNSRAK